jgi:hypothetical protein
MLTAGDPTTGNPGIGKTMMAVYILHQLQVGKLPHRRARKNPMHVLMVHAKHTHAPQAQKQFVVYQAANHPVYCFGWDQFREPHVWMADSVYAFHRLLEISDAWCVRVGTSIAPWQKWLKASAEKCFQKDKQHPYQA